VVWGIDWLSRQAYNGFVSMVPLIMGLGQNSLKTPPLEPYQGTRVRKARLNGEPALAALGQEVLTCLGVPGGGLPQPYRGTGTLSHAHAAVRPGDDRLYDAPADGDMLI